MVKRFNDYSPSDKKSRKKLNEQDFINIVGGQENYTLLKEYKLISEEFILDGATDFFSGLFSTGGIGSVLAKRTGIEIVAGLITPLTQKLGVKKGGLLYYILAYGTQHAVLELGTGLFDPNKKSDFCRAFSVGASQSVVEWTTLNGYSNILELFGLSGQDSMISKILITTIRDKMLNNAKIKNGIEIFICETKLLDDAKGNKVTLWEYVTSMDNLTELIK